MTVSGIKDRVEARLVRNWRAILKRAWSMRFMALAVVFSGLEVALPLLDGVLPIHRGWFAALCGVSVAIAMIARLVMQRGVHEVD
jgi:hypothetical protein